MARVSGRQAVDWGFGCCGMESEFKTFDKIAVGCWGIFFSPPRLI